MGYGLSWWVNRKNHKPREIDWLERLIRVQAAIGPRCAGRPLDDFGFRAVIAPSFADIFFNNSFKNGLLPIALDAGVVDDLFARVSANHGLEISIDLEAQTVNCDGEEIASFEIDAFRKHCMLNGQDDIALTLQHADEIQVYEDKRKQTAPWLF
jgi:3-isopropylmalate/(R)-2-methylmalate dehydratase small subunit